MRRWSLFIGFFIAGAFLGRPFALASLGLLIKAYLFFSAGIFFSYGTVDWESERVVFSDVRLKQPHSFQAQIEQVKGSLSSRFLEVEEPRIQVFEMPRFQGEGNWFFTVKQGWIEKEGMGGVHFSCERNWENQLGRFMFEKEGATCALEILREGKEIWADAVLDSCQLKWLELLMPGSKWEGKVDGKLHLVQVDNAWKRGSACLVLDHGGYQGIVSEIAAEIDWEGSLDRNWFSDGRLRLNLHQGRLIGRFGAMSNLKGDLSFAAGVGAKWMLEGVGEEGGKTFPFSSTARAFLSTLRPCWLEAEASLGQGHFSLLGKEDAEGIHWNGYFRELNASEATLLQGFLTWVHPRFASQGLQEGIFSLEAAGWIPYSGEEIESMPAWEGTIAGDSVLYRNSGAALRCRHGELFMQGKGSDATAFGQFSIDDLNVEIPFIPETAFQISHWYGKGEIADGHCIASEWKGEVGDQNVQASIRGFLEEEGWSLQIRGQAGSSFTFYCPSFQSIGSSIAFDFRIENTLWDWAKVCGIWDERGLHLDLAKTHVLGSPISLEECIWEDGFVRFNASSYFPLSSLSTILAKELPQINDLKGSGIHAELCIDKEKGLAFLLKGPDLHWHGQKGYLDLSLFWKKGIWRFADCHFGDFTFAASLQKEESGIRFSEIDFAWKEALFAQGSGLLHFQTEGMPWEFYSACTTLDLGKLFDASSLKEQGVSGLVEGKGCISWKKGALEADFDCFVSPVHVRGMVWENEGPLHISYSPSQGVLCSGVDLYSSDRDCHIKAGLVEYNPIRERWHWQHARFYLASSFFPSFEIADAAIDWSADFEFPSDFSSMRCFVKEGIAVWQGSSYSVKELSLFSTGSQIQSNGSLCSGGKTVQVEMKASLQDPISGRVQIASPQNLNQECALKPVCIAWDYLPSQGFAIQSIEGAFDGQELGFYRLPGQDVLIGSAKVDFGPLSCMVSDRLSQFFSDLAMGKGYEFKGKLICKKDGLIFDGILSGREVELFGHQFRTLLSKIHFQNNEAKLDDFHISDAAGIMQIDRIEAAGTDETPWTISIPKLSIFELRPSLLRKPGQRLPNEPAGPLVVRELTLENFRGLLDESKTYQATGHLTFINSYRREHTIFDLPSDILGRIMGLDLELLVPVCGQLRYELKDGLFHLYELEQSYSEAHRSEFFLASYPPSTMDLDGNLKILVSMKQFVLFKFTESFLISIDGQLSDPQFHLQKKRRFLGL